MKPQDYPTAHFKFMSDLATNLASMSIQILEHSYTYQAFGSWWFTCNFSGRQYRVVFDGRDSCLSIQEPFGKGWKNMASEQADGTDPAKISGFIVKGLNYETDGKPSEE